MNPQQGTSFYAVHWSGKRECHREHVENAKISGSCEKEDQRKAKQKYLIHTSYRGDSNFYPDLDHLS